MVTVKPDLKHGALIVWQCAVWGVAQAQKLFSLCAYSAWPGCSAANACSGGADSGLIHVSQSARARL
jgi:hypothetical protein